MSPFLHQLAQYGLIPWETYLGVVQFGTETFYSGSKVKFACKSFQAALGTPYGPTNELPPNTIVVGLPTPTGAAMKLMASGGNSILQLVYAVFLVHTFGLFADLRYLCNE